MIIQIDIEKLLETICIGGLIGLLLGSLAMGIGYILFKIEKHE